MVTGLLPKVPAVVATCVVLHNLCLSFNDAFDPTWLIGLEGALKGSPEVLVLKTSMREGVQRMMEMDVQSGELPREALDIDAGYQEACRERDMVARALYHGRTQQGQQDSNSV